MTKRSLKELKELFPHGHPKFIDLTLDELALHNRKNKDYAQGGHPLGNFHRVSTILGLYPGLNLAKPIVVALVYMLKQLDAVLWMLCRGYEGEVEGVDARLADVYVYAKLCRILAKDEDELANSEREGHNPYMINVEEED